MIQLSITFLIKRFAWQFFVWALVLISGFFLLESIALPLIRLIFLNGWDWISAKDWLNRLLTALILSLIPSSAFTLHEWLQYSNLSLVKKIFTTLIVISIIFLFCFGVAFPLMHYFISKVFP